VAPALRGAGFFLTGEREGESGKGESACGPPPPFCDCPFVGRIPAFCARARFCS
jgi:hypothetical protein